MATTKAEAAVTTATEAVVVATIIPAEKITANKTMPTAATKIGYMQKAWNTIPRGPIRRDNVSKKNVTWLGKK